MTKTTAKAIKMFLGRDPDEPVCWLAFRGYWSDGSGLKLPSDLRLADSRGEEDERIETLLPAVAFSKTTRVWYSRGAGLYFFIIYDPDRLEWWGHRAKAKSLAAAIKELILEKPFLCKLGRC
jgi:hypothetical protein